MIYMSGEEVHDITKTIEMRLRKERRLTRKVRRGKKWLQDHSDEILAWTLLGVTGMSLSIAIAHEFQRMIDRRKCFIEFTRDMIREMEEGNYLQFKMEEGDQILYRSVPEEIDLIPMEDIED